MSTLSSGFRALRPKQWTKNIVVLAATVFALFDRSQSYLRMDFHHILAALGAMGIFCMVSSGIYLLNDLKDIELDRAHPTKRLRPLAAGEISKGFAATLAAVLLSAGAFLARQVNTDFFWVIAAYVVLQILYTLGLKRIALVDLFVIAGGFVLRALAGAVAVQVEISSWLLLCTLLLALFLALCKRRHERVVMDDAEGATRPSLRQYDAKLLDQLISMIGAATLVCYALYTLDADTVAKFGTERLGLTIPFVIFGMFRYMDLVYRHEKGGRPEQILLSDIPLLVNLLLYGATVVAVFLAH